MNAAWEELSGFQSPEVLGKPLSLLHGPASDHLALEAAMRAGGEYSGAALLYTKAGAPFVAQLYVAPLPDARMRGAPVHFAVPPETLPRFEGIVYHHLHPQLYRGTSFIPSLGPYSRPMSRALWWS